MAGAQLQIRTLIVDDEPLARKRLRELLKDDPEIQIVGECSNGSETIQAARDLAPELVFLDVQMPELDGLSVSEAIEGPDRPTIIFVTAYDEYAVRAFEVRAIDYLLKPFDRARFAKALQRAKEQLREKKSTAVNQQLLDLLTELKTRPSYLERLVIKTNERVLVLKTDEIDWIEAEGNYVRIHFDKQSSLIRETLSHLASQLDPRKFPRIHRSRLVNIDRIQELQPWSHRDYRIILRNGTELALSRSYREQLCQLLGKV
ncbi:MAG TPA: LytTR family DNA-binding domain-containing protein [Blastocatellia bacterium]|nr:LytTR family DNA-binding domain-containing protein [Blastocatellia bacterium]